MAKHNIAKMTTATTGTGTITLGSAVAGFLTFDQAGVADGEGVEYTIRDGSDTEVGLGFYATTGATLTRPTIYSSTNGGAAISLSGSAEVMITAPALDGAMTILNGSAVTITNNSTAYLVIDNYYDVYAGLAHVGTGLDAGHAVMDLEGVYDIDFRIYIYANTGTLGGSLYIEAYGDQTYVFTESVPSLSLTYQYVNVHLCGQYLSPSDPIYARVTNHLGVSCNITIDMLVIKRLGPWI